MRLRPHTIRARVTLYTCATLVVSLAVAAFLIDEEVRDQAQNALDDRLRSEADSLAALTRFDGTRFELQFEDETMRTFSRAKNGAFFQVSSRDGVIERSASLGGESLPAPSDEYMRRSETNRTRHTERTTLARPNDSSWRLLTLYTLRRTTESADADAAPYGAWRAIAIQVARSMAEIDHAQEEVREAMVIGLPLAFLLGTICTLLVAGRATRRIREMSEAATTIASGAVAARIDSQSVDGELATLAATLNRAFDRLAAQADRERRFAAMVAHELRTPIAIARARIEVALSRERDATEYRSALAVTGAAVSRLEALVESLLLLARAENARFARETVDLRQIVASAAEEARSAAAARGATGEVALTLDPEAAPVLGDAGLLQRAIANLLHNALVHGALVHGGVGVESPRAEVSLAQADGRATVIVRDRGPGFPSEVIPQLFERLTRADRSRSRSTGGAGLGLAIAHAIVNAHGGDIAAENREGGGAQVRIDLPLAPPAQRLRPDAPQRATTAV